MRSSQSIDVKAPPQRVFDLASQLERWPEFLPHYHSVTVQSRKEGRVLARMVARRYFGRVAVPVAWRAEQWADETDPADLRLHFRHVGGVTRGMEVSWHIRPSQDGSRLSIEHDFARRLPLLGENLLPSVVNRFFIRPIAGRTLATFKALAESAA